MKKLLLSLMTLALLNTSSFAKKPIEVFDKPTGLVDIWDDKPDRIPKHPVNIEDIPGEDKKPIELWEDSDKCLNNFSLEGLVGAYAVTVGPGKGSGYGVTMPVPKDKARAGKIVKQKKSIRLKVGFGNVHVVLTKVGCNNTKKVSKLVGKGTFVSEDGTTVRCNMQLVVHKSKASNTSAKGTMHYNAGGVKFQVKIVLRRK